MEIIRIPTAYALQMKHLSDSDISYVMKSIFVLSSGDVVEIEDNMRGGLVQSIWRETVQLENKARAKKGEKQLCYQLATLGATPSTKRCDQVKSNQTNSSQSNSNQNTEIVVSQPNEYQLSISYLKENRDKVFTQELQIPDYAENYRDEWHKFVGYWSELSKTGKLKAEGEKTFEIKRRFATWMSRKKETYQQKQKESALDITL